MISIYRFCLITFLFVAVITGHLAGQDFLGLTESNYAGIQGIHMNPSSIVDSRYKVDVNLIGMDLGIGNNYLGLRRELFSFDANEPQQGESFRDTYLSNNPSRDFKHFFINANFYLPSVMYTINKKHTVAFTWSFRNYFNINKVDPDLAQLAWEGFDHSPLWNIDLDNDELDVQTMSWAEYGLTYGTVLWEDETHFLKGAIRVKYLQGINAAYFFAEDLNYLFFSKDSIRLAETRFSYGHSDNFFVDEDGSLGGEEAPLMNKFIQLLMGGEDGGIRFRNTSRPSFGVDLGLTYEHRPNYGLYRYEEDGEMETRDDLNKYKWRAGLGITDLGGIRFETGIYSKDFQVREREIVFSTLGDSVGTYNPDSILEYLFRFYEVPESFWMSLPTALTFQFDYHIWRNLYVSTSGVVGVQLASHRVNQITRFNITPRWDHRWYGAFVPVTFNQYKQFHAGLALRLGPLMVGTNDLGVLFKEKLTGANLYMALKVPIPQSRPKFAKQEKVPLF